MAGLNVQNVTGGSADAGLAVANGGGNINIGNGVQVTDTDAVANGGIGGPAAAAGVAGPLGVNVQEVTGGSADAGIAIANGGNNANIGSGETSAFLPVACLAHCWAPWAFAGGA